MSKKALTLAICLSSLIFGASAIAGEFTGAGQLLHKVQPKQSYSGSQERPYEIYVPKSYVPGTPVPMVMALHGCVMEYDGRSPSDVMKEWNFDLLADRDNFIIVTPFLKTYDGMRASNCWGYWMDHHIHNGKGEVEDLMRIARSVEKEFSIDPKRRFVTGLSAGGALGIALSITNPYYWTAAAPVEGLPYGDWSNSVAVDPEQFKSLSELLSKAKSELAKTPNARMVPFLEIHSINDEISRVQSGDHIRDVWLSIWGKGTSHPVASSTDCSYEGIACTDLRYTTEDGRTIITTRRYNGDQGWQKPSYGTGHYWVGDDDSRDNWSYAKGPSNSEAIWKFFKAHGGDELSCSPTDDSATLNWNSIPDATGYKIYVNEAFNTNASTAPTSISGLAPNTEYRFKLEAMKGSAVFKTMEATCKTLKYSPPLPPPQGISANGVDSTSIALTWSAVSGAAGYKIYRVFPDVKEFSVAGTSFTDTGLSRNSRYAYQVATNNAANKIGTKSSEVSGMTQDFEVPSQSAHDTATMHYVGKRLTVQQYLCTGSQYGYINKLTLYKCAAGWTDQATCQRGKCFP